MGFYHGSGPPTPNPHPSHKIGFLKVIRRERENGEGALCVSYIYKPSTNVIFKFRLFGLLVGQRYIADMGK